MDIDSAPPNKKAPPSTGDIKQAMEHYPICCRWIPSMDMFRVLRSKGKALNSGGFGVSIPTKIEQPPPLPTTATASEPNSATNDVQTSSTEAAPASSQTASDTTTTPTQTLEYLFIEEVIFLHERGLLLCLSPDPVGDSPHDHDDNDNDEGKRLPSPSGTQAPTSKQGLQATNTLDSSQLYQLLPRFGMSLPVYLVYAHLRAQDYRVLRHSKDRYDLLVLQQRQQEERSQQQEQQKTSNKKRQREEQHENMLPAPSGAEEGYLSRNGKRDRQEDVDNDENHETATSMSTSAANAIEKEDPQSAVDNSNSLSEPIADDQSTHIRKKLSSLRHKVRLSIQNAPIPTVLDDQIGIKTSNVSLKADPVNVFPAFDVYEPSSQFAKTHPGFPSFYVAITYYNYSPRVTFNTIQTLVHRHEVQNRIPMKLATVSDSGTVIMFGLSSRGAPDV